MADDLNAERQANSAESGRKRRGWYAEKRPGRAIFGVASVVKPARRLAEGRQGENCVIAADLGGEGATSLLLLRFGREIVGSGDGFAARDQRFQHIAGAIGETRDEIFEDRSSLAGQDRIDRVPIDAIELGERELLEHRAGGAQFFDGGLEHVLLLKLDARPFFKSHDSKARSRQRLDSRFDVDLEGWQRPAMPITVTAACKQRRRQRHIVDTAGEEAHMIEGWTQRVHADAWNRPIAWLEPDDAVERRRPNHRAERLRAERKRYEAGGDRCR